MQCDAAGEKNIHVYLKSPANVIFHHRFILMHSTITKLSFKATATAGEMYLILLRMFLISALQGSKSRTIHKNAKYRHFLL